MLTASGAAEGKCQVVPVQQHLQIVDVRQWPTRPLALPTPRVVLRILWRRQLRMALSLLFRSVLLLRPLDPGFHVLVPPASGRARELLRDLDKIPQLDPPQAEFDVLRSQSLVPVRSVSRRDTPGTTPRRTA